MLVECIEDWDSPSHRMAKGGVYDVTPSIGRLGVETGKVRRLEETEIATISAPETMEARKPTTRKKPAKDE